jgi:hypothetical protein
VLKMTTFWGKFACLRQGFFLVLHKYFAKFKEFMAYINR